MARPVVVCRSACAILEDRLGNDATVIGLAAQRLFAHTDHPHARALLRMILRSAQRIARLHEGLTPCDDCLGCNGPDRTPPARTR